MGARGSLAVASWQPPAAVATSWGMAAFLPTRELMADISAALGREPSDPAVIAAFDQLVLRGQLVPFVPDWWELMGWLPGELGQVLQRGR